MLAKVWKAGRRQVSSFEEENISRPKATKSPRSQSRQSSAKS